jgi:protein-ribulosamine 3-kinase
LPETKASLLHGDLWSGNFMIGPKGKAVLIDPAVYYGPAEAELAFTTLFGGFEDEFYKAYQEAHALEKGYEKRFDLYNLYPLLVHVNLFGRSYLSGIRNVLLANS